MNKAPGLWHEVKPAKAPDRARTAWLLTMVDLTGLLVGFFVLLFSTKVIERDVWQDLSGGFRQALGSGAAVVPSLPDGTHNALKVVETRKDVLPYLDSLLRNRLKDDPAWSGLRGVEVNGKDGHREMVYALPAGVLDGQSAEAQAAWRRLAGVVRAWKNPVAVRAVIGEGDDIQKGAEVVGVLASVLAQAGARGVTGQVVSGNIGGIQFVVRGD